jgi:hypothetical protein
MEAVRDAARCYWRLRDAGDVTDERGQAHNALLDTLEAAGIPFEDREHAAQIGLTLMNTPINQPQPMTTLMATALRSRPGDAADSRRRMGAGGTGGATVRDAAGALRELARMRHIDVCTGIGGFPLAASWVWGASYTPVAFCEQDAYCQAWLRSYWPDVPCVPNIYDFQGDPYAGTIDLFTAGEIGRAHV